MRSRFFDYCSIERKRLATGGLIVRRHRPSPVLLLAVLLPLGCLAILLAVRVQPSGQPLVLLGLLLLAVVAYCVDGYRSIQPRTWAFDQARREVSIDGQLTQPFERLLRVEIDQQRVRGSRESYTRFTLTLSWIGGPERAYVSRFGSEVSSVALEIAEYVGVPLLHTGEGRELQEIHPS